MKTFILLTGVASVCFVLPAAAQEAVISGDHEGVHHEHHSMDHSTHHAGGHHHSGASAPIGVMGDHLHPKGEWMVSYRFQHMKMDGNRDGTDELSPVEIATTVPNRFAGVAGQPPTLRVVPTEMSMNMHMFGAMYGARDWLTLMAMGMWMEKDMDHTTFQGGAGTTVLGQFETQSEGWGDTVVSSLIRLHQDDTYGVHLNLGLSIPTGSIKNTDTVLAPNGMTPRLRLPYAMQLGTGTYDVHPGITYSGHKDAWSWGAQYKAEIRLEDENDQGYAWGDKHAVTSWAGYQWTDLVSSSLRVSASTQGKIDGIDPNIVAPVQTADPDNYGGEIVEAGFGVNFTGQTGWMRGHELGVEVNVPVYQDLNGPQMQRDYTLTLGFKKSF